MARSAKLTSIDAVRDMAAALTLFAEEVASALDELDINIRRATEWIEHDRYDYWKHEMRRSQEKLGEARVELEKALTYRKMADQTPSCRQERAMLEKAKHRAQTAEERKRSLPQWSHTIKHSVQELQGMQRQLSNWLNGEFPKALGTLHQMAATLERYSAVQAGPDLAGPVSRGGEEETEVDKAEVKPEEPDDESMGSAHTGGEAPSGDSGSGSGQRENK